MARIALGYFLPVVCNGDNGLVSMQGNPNVQVSRVRNASIALRSRLVSTWKISPFLTNAEADSAFRIWS